MNKFINTAKPIEKQHLHSYGFTDTPQLLLMWSSLFQRTVSIAGTYMLTNKWHTQECGIYKCEGGANIVGIGELVMKDDCCYWNYGKHDKNLYKLSDMITNIVLNWDPNDPINSMLETTSKYIKVSVQELKTAIENSRGGGVFGGDCLSDFFDRNPFGDMSVEPTYRRYCLTNYGDMTDEDVDQLFTDEAKGKELLNQLQKASRDPGVHIARYWWYCCYPKRVNNELKFWINGEISNWHTEQQVLDLIKSIKNRTFDKKTYVL